jgi:hypothetical protein
MKRTSSTSWVATEGPSGLCGNVEVNTLERDPKHDNLWTFTWVRANAIKDGALCAVLQTNKPTTWSWKVPRKFTLTKCRRFEFGF